VSAPERIIAVRPRTVLLVLGLVLLVGGGVFFVWQLWKIVLWLVAAMILAVALNPVVEFFERRGIRRAGAALLVLVLAVAVIGGLAYVAIPPLVTQVTNFVEAIPKFVDDLTAGRGPLGFLQTDYHIVDRVREAINEKGAGGVFGITERGLGVARSVISVVISLVAIVFLTLFMLLQGPATVRWIFSLVPETMRPRFERAGWNMYRSVGGYVTGNLLISVIAGAAMGITLWAVGSQYALALAVIIAFFDLIPLVGATLAAVVVVTVVTLETSWARGLIVLGLFLVYQQLENHLLQPLIYGRMVQLSPLAVLVSVLVGAELAGIFGALAAIPVAGGIQAVFREVMRYRSETAEPRAVSADTAPP
jgi:predicted PurR-regulated permease PerM